jgi:hypothetical protein
VSPYTVVAIESTLENTLQVRIAKAPIAIPGAPLWGPFACDPDTMPPWSQNGAVQAHGHILRQQLAAHPGVASALQQIAGTPLTSTHALYFQVGGNAERFHWEALWDDNDQFLSLDSRWPIARVADSAVIASQSSSYTFAPPLRIAALLSAVKITAEPQWKKLYAAVEGARQQGLEIEMRVFVGEEDLLAAIRSEIENSTVTGVQAEPMPQNGVEVAAALAAFPPHLLHFFCHGSVSHGKAQLELATIADWDLGVSSVTLGMNQLGQMPALQNTWLVTLNCCEGSKAVGDLQSMAHRLVETVVPAAVGMLEPIDAADAHEFCGAFYTALLQALQRLQGIPAGQSAGIEWAEALHLPRSLLSLAHPTPESRREWTFPVLYVRPGEFRVQREAALTVLAVAPQALDNLNRRVEAVATVLRGLPPETPAEIRDQILATISDIPPELRPDRNGNFQEQPDGG